MLAEGSAPTKNPKLAITTLLARQKRLKFRLNFGGLEDC